VQPCHIHFSTYILNITTDVVTISCELRIQGAKRPSRKTLDSEEGYLGLGAFFIFKRSCLTVIRRNSKNQIKGFENRIRTNFLPAQGLGVGVETEKNSLVDKRIFLLGPGAFLSLLAGGSNNRLDFIAIDQTSNIRVGDFSSREAKG
jgi:hypothetical protein